MAARPPDLDTPGTVSSCPLSAAALLHRLSGGFDNVGFHLDSLGDPGSRKPFVSVHVRTLPPDEQVRSSLGKQPSSLPLHFDKEETYQSISVIKVFEEGPGKVTVASELEGVGLTSKCEAGRNCGLAASRRGSESGAMVRDGGASLGGGDASVVCSSSYSKVPSDAKCGYSGAKGFPASVIAVLPPPTVSALTKVSSVRIGSTPVTTPTPSVCGNDNASQSSRGGPVSSLRARLKVKGPLFPIRSVLNQQPASQSLEQSSPSEPSTEQPQQTDTGGASRRDDRERRRERRERRRERRAHRMSRVPLVSSGPQTDVLANEGHVDSHLPDLLNSHIPPPYSTLPSGPRSLGGGIVCPPITSVAAPAVGLIPPPPSGTVVGPSYPTSSSPVRQQPPPPPDTSWQFFGSRRSRCSGRGATYLGEDEAKSCCGLLVTQAVSIRWFIIMIAFVGLCCTVVGTVLGAVKTHNSEYVTITLLMIGVGIVLITVSGVAWHLTSRDAPCRVMLGLAPSRSGEPRRFMARMAPSFGRPHHPYAAMMYPEFQYRPPPPTYQASMQEYRLRLLLLDRQGHGPHPPPPPNIPSPPPIYRTANQTLRSGTTTLGRESEYSRPPSYRSRDGSVSQHPEANPRGTGHSRDPSCLSIFSHESVYSGVDGSSSKLGMELPFSKKKLNATKKDGNTVTIVQTTDSSQVIGSDSVVVTVSGTESNNRVTTSTMEAEISVLAHL